MPRTDVVVECPLYRSFRVEQLAGMFDVPLEQRCRESFSVEVPGRSEAWTIGAIVGPSGSGKSTVARQTLGDDLYQAAAWPDEKAVIDGFGERPIKQIIATLTSVGFSSPPSWIKPYRVLSRGEQFRCDLARALLSNRDLVAFDEFTSVVDRTVAKVGSAAVSRAVRKSRPARRFVAVTCHYDIIEWLEPDWVLDMATGRLTRRRLRRPTIRLELRRCRHSIWPMFARYHYLSGSLSRAARTWVALYRGVAVAFCATLSVIGRKNHRRISRIVTLPDYQGIGIGMAVVRAVADLHLAEGHRLNMTAGHPAVIAHCRRSPCWRTVGVRRAGSRGRRWIANYRNSLGRAVVSFEYLGRAAAGVPE